MDRIILDKYRGGSDQITVRHSKEPVELIMDPSKLVKAMELSIAYDIFSLKSVSSVYV